MDGVRMVFFDAGHTLLRTRERVGEVYARAARRQGLCVEPRDVESAFRQAFHEQKLDGRPQDRAWWRRLVLATFRSFGTARDPEALFDELYLHFTAPDSWVLYEGARETVVALRERGYRTGLISNWDDRLPELLHAHALAGILDPVVISYRVGVEKPHRRIFETALAEAGIAPGEALMVGDDPEADAEGARAVGMRAVLVHQPAAPANGAPRLERIADLLDVLPAAAPGNGRA